MFYIYIKIPYQSSMLILCCSQLPSYKDIRISALQFTMQMLTFKDTLTLTRCLQFERHKKFVGDYILYYGGQMADFKRSV